MRSPLFLCALAGVVAMIAPAAAAPAASVPLTAAAPAPTAAPASPPEAPQVTILNRASEAPAESSAPSSPAAPENPAAPAEATKPDAAGSAANAGPDHASPDAAASQPAAPAQAVETAAPSPAGAAPSGPSPEAAAEAATEPAGPPPEPTLAIDIDLTTQTMVVAENGRVTHRWPVSSARYGYRTPTGTFQPVWMSKMWYSRQYDYAPMPHAIFFHQGVAIHGSYAIGALGRPASHGCVRLAPRNAQLLYKLVNQHGKARTEIVVHGTPDHSSSRVAAEDRYDRDGLTPIRRSNSYYFDYPPSVRRTMAYSPYGYSSYGYRYAPRERRYTVPARRVPRGYYSAYPYGYGF